MYNLPLGSPDITDRERELVLQVLSTPVLSGGPMVQRFEAMAAERAGTKHAIAASSGTAGLHLIVRGLGLGPGDIVITTPYSFIASSNCLLYEGVEPLFVDIEEGTFNIAPDRVLDTLAHDPRRDRVRGILAVDIFGHPAQWGLLEDIARQHGLKLIEDSAESLGSSLDGRRCGGFGDAAIFAFYPNKQMTTGEGGVVLTDDDDLAEMCRSLRNQGRGPSSEWLEHVRLGYNYRLSELHAALGVAQFERLDEMLQKRATVAAWYAEGLQDIEYLTPPRPFGDVEVSWFVYVVRLKEARYRPVLMPFLRSRGIPTRPYFPAIHLMPFYQEQFGFKKGDFPITEAVAETTLALPYHNNMTQSEVAYVCDQLRAAQEILA